MCVVFLLMQFFVNEILFILQLTLVWIAFMQCSAVQNLFGCEIFPEYGSYSITSYNLFVHVAVLCIVKRPIHTCIPKMGSTSSVNRLEQFKLVSTLFTSSFGFEPLCV